MPIRICTAVLLLFFMACGPTPEKKATAKIVSPDDFPEFVLALKVVEPPTAYLHFWDTINARYMYGDTALQFEKMYALLLPVSDSFVSILYYGITAADEKKYIYWPLIPWKVI